MEKIIIDIIAFVRKRWFFLDGLVALLFLVSLIYFWFANSVGVHLLQVVKACGIPLPMGFADSAFLIGFITLLVLAFIFWHKSRSIPKFRKDELGILFAPDFDEEIEKEVNRLFIHLRQEIKSHEIGNRFSLKQLPPNLTISSASEATAMLRGAGGVVAVWGPLEQQSSGQGKTTGFSKLSISFVHRPALISISRQKSLAISLSMSMVGKQYHIHDRTQIADRSIMARNIGLIVRNVMGVALVHDQNFKEAIKIMGPLLVDLRATFPNKGSVGLKRFNLQVQYDFAFSLTIVTVEEYHKYLVKEKLYDIQLPVLERWLRNVEQALSLDPQNSVHYIAKGIYLFLKGDVDGAIKAEKRAERLAPRAVSNPNFSLAFLYNFKGKFKLSRDQYRIGLAKKTSFEEEMISECIEFTKQTIAKFPEKKQLRLALAVLELNRGNKEHGIRTLKEMLADPPHEPELQDFTSEAKNLLERVKSDESLDSDR